MTSTLLKPVINELKVGRYQSAVEYIAKNKLEEINGDNGLRVLIAAAQGLGSSTESPKWLVEIIKLLEFEVLNGDNLSDYLCCIFHIVKYIINSENLEFILQLENYIIPPFIANTQLETKQVTHLKGLCNILHNNFLKILNNLNDHDTESTYSNCKLLMDLSVNAVKNFLPRFQSYISSLLYYEYNSEKIKELYKYLFELIKSKKLKVSEENFKALIMMLQYMCKHFVAKKEFGLILEYFRISENKLVEAAGDSGDFVKRVLAIAPLLTTFNAYPETSVEILNDFTEVLIEAAENKFYADLMVPLITTLLDEAIRTSEDCDINRILSISFGRTFFKTVDALSKLSTGIESKCCCDINYDIYTVLRTVSIKSLLMQHLIMFERFDEDLHAEVMNHFTYSFRLLTLLWKKNCKILNSQWRLNGSILYNIAMKLYQMKDDACMSYLELFTKTVFEIEGVENSLIQEDISNKSLQMLVEMLMLNKCYQKGLQVSALNIFLHPKSSKWPLQQWIKCKSALGKEFRNATLVSVINDNEAYLKNFYGGFQKVTDPETIVDLLKLELNTYKKYWRCSICNVLYELKEYMDLVKLGKEISSIEYVDLANTDRNILSDLLEPCIEYIETISKDEELHLILGYLYFVYFKFSYQELVNKNDKELNSLILPPKPEQLEPIDVNNECDINPSYRFLQIFTCNQTFQYLNKSLMSFNIGIQSGIKDPSLISKVLVNVSTELAYEFKVHCDLLNFLKAMFVTLEFAGALKDDGLVIRTVAAVMEYLDINSKKFKSLKLQCDDIITRVENLDLKIYCRYYTSLALAYMKCDRFIECNEMYEKATDYYYKLENDKALDFIIVKLHYLYLEALLANVACMHSITNHDSLALSQLYSTYNLIVLSLRSATKPSSEFLSISFDALENLLNFYVCMRLPREVRCFGHGIYLLAQELVLPFRVVRLTIYLAKADLLSCRFADCEVKLEKLSNILGLNQSTWKEDEDLCEITIKVEDLCLENPSMQRITSANSPKLFSSKFKLPSFTTHGSTCDCFPCSSIEYKDLVMQKIHLDAMLSAAHDDSKSTLVLFKGISSIHEYITKTPIQTPENVSLNVQFYASTYNHFMLDHIRYYAKRSDYETANVLNARLYKKMRREINKSFHLYNEVLKLHWLLTDDSTEEIKTVDESEEVLELNAEDVKTPERKISERTLSPVVLSPLAIASRKSPAFLVPETPVPNINFKMYTPETSSMKKPMSSARRMVRKNLCKDLENTKSTEKSVRTKKFADNMKKPGVKIFCDDSDGDEKLKKPALRSTRKMAAQKLLEQHQSPKNASSDDEERLTHLELTKSAKKYSNRLKKSVPRRTEYLGDGVENYTNQIKKPTPRSTRKRTETVTVSASKGAVRKYTRKKTELETLKLSTNINIDDGLKTPSDIKTEDAFDNLIKSNQKDVMNDLENNYGTTQEMQNDVFDDLKKSTSNLTNTHAKKLNTQKNGQTPKTLEHVESGLDNFKSLRINVLDITPLKGGAVNKSKGKVMPLKEMQTDEVKNLEVVERSSSRLKKLADKESGCEEKVRRTTRRIIN